MALPVIADHYYVQSVFERGDEDPVTNTFCFRNHRDVIGESPTTPALQESLRDLLDSFYGTGATTGGGVGNYLSGQLHGLRYVIYDLGSPDAGAGEIESATFRTAVSSGDSRMPPDAAAVITWRTGNRGRSYRGRTYIGPLRQSAIDTDGHLLNAAATQFASVAPLLIGAEATRDWELHVLSRAIPTATPVIRGDVDLEFDTQRRRGFRTASRISFTAP